MKISKTLKTIPAMKKLMIILTAVFALATSANAMSYEQARQQALFLTDKMAYELNLTEDQYEAAYEINLDYLMGVNSYDDVYGTYWTHRNLDMSYVLFDWQYRAFCAASYFYRPIYWNAGYWHFAIYARYPRRDYFYFGRPHFWHSYRGGHSWHYNGGHSWYHGRRFGEPGRPGGRHFGMQDGHRRGDYRNGFNNRPGGNNNMGTGRRDPNRYNNGNRHNNGFGNGNRPNRGDNANRPNDNKGNRPSTGFGSGNRPNRGDNANRPSDNGVNNGSSTSGSRPQYGNPGNRPNGGTRGFGNRRDNSSSNFNRPTRESSTRTTVTRTPNSGSTSRNFGTPSRSYSSPSRSFSPGHSSGSSVSRSSGSFSGGSRGGGSHVSGGSHGGRR